MTLRRTASAKALRSEVPVLLEEQQEGNVAGGGRGGLGVTKDKVRVVPAHLDSFGLILSGREATARVFFKAFKMTAAPLQTIPATAGKKARVTLRTRANRVSPAFQDSSQRALRNGAFAV